MDNNTVSRILRMYGYAPTGFLPVQKGYRNEAHPFTVANGQLYNLLVYKNEPGIVQTIRNANDVSNFLAGSGLPSRRTIDERIVQVHGNHWHRYAVIYSYLPGETIPWEGYTMKHIKLLGQTMSDMHASLTAYTSSLPDVTDQYRAVMQQVGTYFRTPAIRDAMSTKLGVAVLSSQLSGYTNILKAAKGASHQQALHMDFVRSNILFNNAPMPAISGILDFEKTARGHCLFDIARTLAFLLVDCKYTPADKVRKYFLYSGYQKRGTRPLQRIILSTPGGKVELLECLLDMFLLYDFYKFLRHNPYESLKLNEHYIRTRDILLQRQRLARVRVGPVAVPQKTC